MAILSPSLIPTSRTDAGRYRELDVLAQLRDHLPQQFEVFHSIPLHSAGATRDSYGEIDVAVLAPNGCVLLMEIKAGAVVLRDGDIFKVYRDGECEVARQGRMQRNAMQHRLQEAGLRTDLYSCLVLPDYYLGAGNVISIPRERIIDASRYCELTSLVQQWLSVASGSFDHAALRLLLSNQFRVTPQLDVLRDQLQGTVRQLADGLATWVPRIDAPSGIYRIEATAGSGKTQLALQLLQAAARDRATAAYVCFNRTLADHVRRFAPSRTEVANFHELCVEHHRRRYGEPEFDQPKAFERVAGIYVEESNEFAARLDLLIVDEAQDFEPEWIESLGRQLKPGGRLYLLEDEHQRLYPRASFEMADAVRIECRDNFRSPRAICEVINGLRLAPPINSMNPYYGELPAIQTYHSDEQLLAATREAVAAMLARGFALDDIAIVCGRGHGKSSLLGLERIGPWATRRYVGEYDRNGEPRWSQGELLVESVYRYKGQSAPAVIVAEFDFDALDDSVRRKLFVALTRARLAASMVLSARAEACLAAALESGT